MFLELQLQLKLHCGNKFGKNWLNLVYLGPFGILTTTAWWVNDAALICDGDYMLGLIVSSLKHCATVFYAVKTIWQRDFLQALWIRAMQFIVISELSFFSSFLAYVLAELGSFCGEVSRWYLIRWSKSAHRRNWHMLRRIGWSVGRRTAWGTHLRGIVCPLMKLLVRGKVMRV